MKRHLHGLLARLLENHAVKLEVILSDQHFGVHGTALFLSASDLHPISLFAVDGIFGHNAQLFRGWRIIWGVSPRVLVDRAAADNGMK